MFLLMASIPCEFTNQFNVFINGIKVTEPRSCYLKPFNNSVNSRFSTMFLLIAKM